MGQKSSRQGQADVKMPESQNKIKTIQISNQNYDFSDKNQQVAIACDRIRIYELEELQEVAVIIHAIQPISVKYSSDGELIASSERDCSTYIWNLKTHEIMYKTDYYLTRYYILLFSPNNQYMAYQLGSSQIKFWKFKDNQVWILNNRNTVGLLEYISNKILISATTSINLRFWNLNTSKFTTKFANDYLTYLKSSKTGHQILSVPYTGFMKYWDTKSKKIIRKYKIMYKGQVVALSPDSKFIASTYKEFVQIRCSMTANIIQELTCDQKINQIQFSQESKLILWNSYQSLNVIRLQS